MLRLHTLTARLSGRGWVRAFTSISNAPSTPQVRAGSIFATAASLQKILAQVEDKHLSTADVYKLLQTSQGTTSSADQATTASKAQSAIIPAKTALTPHPEFQKVVRVCHSWNAVFADVVETLTEYTKEFPDTHFWIDLPDTHTNPLTAAKARDLVARLQSASRMLVVVAPFLRSDVLTRVDHLFEIGSALHLGLQVDIRMPKYERDLMCDVILDDLGLVPELLAPIDIESSASDTVDQRFELFELLNQSAGIASTNASLTRTFKKFYLNTMQAVVSEVIANEAHDKTLAVCVSRLASDLLEANETQIGIDMYNQALRVSRTACGEVSAQTVNIYNELGLAYGKLGDNVKAIEYFEKVLPLNTQLHGANDLSATMIHNSLAIAHSLLGNHEKAIEGFQAALQIQIEYLGPFHLAVAGNYNNIGNSFTLQGKLEQAVQAFEKNHNICQTLLGDDNEETAMSLFTLAHAVFKTGDYPKALAHHLKALSSLEKVHLESGGHVSIAASHFHLGMTYFRLGDVAMANKALEQAEQMYTTLSGPNHNNTINVRQWRHNITHAHTAET